MSAELKKARQVCREAYVKHGFHSPEYNEAFEAVRAITSKMIDEAPPTEFFSIDSGFHRTKLLDGRII